MQNVFKMPLNLISLLTYTYDNILNQLCTGIDDLKRYKAVENQVLKSF